MTGRFITLEGGEGAGKSTQAQALAARLKAIGKTVVLSREPGGSPWAETLRKALVSDAGRALASGEQAILFAAARADHVAQLIEPALTRGDWVVCDRFSDSTEAYQGAAGASSGMMALLKHVAVGDLQPDLTLVLDVQPEEGRRRAQERDALDAFEADEFAVQEARRAAFLSIAERDKDRCVVIDAAQPQQAVTDAIWAAVEEHLLAPAGVT